MSILIEQSNYEAIATGRYVGKVTRIEETDGQFGPQLKFQFELAPDEQGNVKNIQGWASKKFSTKSKLYEWTRAILGGAPISPDYLFNLDELIGKKAWLNIVEDEGEKGMYNRIDSIKPLSYSAVTARPLPTQMHSSADELPALPDDIPW